MSPLRKFGPYEVSAVGYGCMNLSHGYGPPQTRETAERVIRRALDLGVTHFDTAALYGFGANEQLVGSILGTRPDNVIVASKCGLFGREGKRVMDGRPEAIRAVCEQSLRSLKTDRIDLYYLHRWEKQIPIEESVGAMADLLRAGKIRAIGLSEVGAATLRRAHAVHPDRRAAIRILAVDAQSRDCGARGVPAHRRGVRGVQPAGPRNPHRRHAQSGRHSAKGISGVACRVFRAPISRKTSGLLEPLAEIAASAGCTRAQLALGWVLARAPHALVIPGTTQEAHLVENCGADAIRLDAATIARLDELLPPGSALGARYPPATQVENDTEEIGQRG